ncbi:MAG: GEVED domain-containing protein, partial [Bacteroidales bacterium]
QPVNGWNNHVFQQPFIWDGQQNIVIEVCFNNSNWVSAGNASIFYSTTPANSVARYNGDNANVCSAPASVTTIADRPNMKLELAPTGCTSARVPLYITVSAAAAADAGVSQIIQPISAVSLGSQETVQVKVKNYGTVAQSNIPVSFQIDALTPVTETITSTIPSGDSLIYTFIAKANLGIVGNTYQIKAYTNLTGDITYMNDTAWKTIQNMYPNYCISTATSGAYEELVNVTLHTLNNTSAPSSAMYTDFTQTVPAPVLSPGMNYPISISSTYAPNYTGSYPCYVKAWIDYNRDGVFDPTAELAYQSVTSTNNTVTGTVTIPPTALSGNTRMRVVFVETSSATSVNPCGTYTWGETEDYLVTISPQSNCDAGIIAILEPSGLQTAGATLPVYVKFMNFGSDTIQANTLSVAYVFNNGTPVVTNYPSTLAPMGQDSLYLPNITLNLGNNTLCVTTVLSCDSVQFNDEQCLNVFGQFQTSVPYFDDFETANNWYRPSSGVNWQLGTPNANVINSAYSGTKAWVTNLTGDYSNNANEYIYSPQFDFSSLGQTDTITLSFYHWADMATNDYGRVQYTKDGGVNWSNLGFMNDLLGTNWYNAQSGGVHYFSLPNTGWQYSAFKLDPYYFNTTDTIQFRFNFVSNATGSANGWAVDNFKLSLPMVPNDIGVTSIDYPVNDTAIGSLVHPTVTITNFGSNAQVMFPVVLKVNGTVVATEIWTGNLPSLGTTQYTFVQNYTVPATAYPLCAQTQMTGDGFTVNDEKCMNLGVLPAINDVGISQIVDPGTGNICFYHATGQPWYQYPVIVRINNYGQNAQTSIPLEYVFQNGGQVYTDTWTGNLAPGNHTDYTLSNLFKPNLGAQQMCVETKLTGDALNTNNKSCESYVGVACIGIDNPEGNRLVLHQNIPNPATGTTSIRFDIPRDGQIRLGVMNLVGQTVFLTEQTFSVGEHQIDLDISNLAAGVYQYFIEFNGYRLTRKMVVSR